MTGGLSDAELARRTGVCARTYRARRQRQGLPAGRRPAKSWDRDQRIVAWLSGRGPRERSVVRAALGLTWSEMNNAINRLRAAGVVAPPSDGLVRLLRAAP